jgi:hypothetical protein
MEKINAVEMVRQIRDKQYEETKKMSRPDLLIYYIRNGGKALNKLRKIDPGEKSPQSSE